MSDAPQASGAFLETLAAANAPESRREFYRVLLDARVLIPLQNAPSGMAPGVHAVQDEVSIQVRFWKDPDGKLYLPLFFTPDRLETVAAIAWRSAAVNYISVALREFLALEHQEGTEGCVLDPGGAAIYLTRLDMADLAAGQAPGTMRQLLLVGELDGEAKSEALALLPAYRFYVVVGAEVDRADDLGVVLFRRHSGDNVLPLFTTPAAARVFAQVWGMVQADGNISTDYVSGADMLARARRGDLMLGIDPGSKSQLFYSPAELKQE